MNNHQALTYAEACATIAIKLFNQGEDPYFMEASEIEYRKMVCLSGPVKCAQLFEYLGMERKVVDLAMKHLKEDDKESSPKRDYWEIV